MHARHRRCLHGSCVRRQSPCRLSRRHRHCRSPARAHYSRVQLFGDHVRLPSNRSAPYAARSNLHSGGETTRITFEENVGVVPVVIRTRGGVPVFERLSVAKLPEVGPFAGHPTLGTAHVLATLGTTPPRSRSPAVFALCDGPPSSSGRRDRFCWNKDPAMPTTFSRSARISRSRATPAATRSSPWNPPDASSRAIGTFTAVKGWRVGRHSTHGRASFSAGADGGVNPTETSTWAVDTVDPFGDVGSRPKWGRLAFGSHSSACGSRVSSQEPTPRTWPLWRDSKAGLRVRGDSWFEGLPAVVHRLRVDACGR